MRLGDMYTYFDMEQFCRLKLECLREKTKYTSNPRSDTFNPESLTELDDIQADQYVRELLLGDQDRLNYFSNTTAKQRFHCNMRLKFALKWIEQQRRYDDARSFDKKTLLDEIDLILTEKFHASMIRWLLEGVEVNRWNY